MARIDALEAALEASQARHDALFLSVALFPSPRQRYPLATDAQIDAIRVASLGVIAAFRRFVAAKFGADTEGLAAHAAEIRAMSTEEYREYRAIHG